MKSFTLLLRLFAVFGLVMMFGVSGFGDTLPDTDDFNTSAKDGWSGTNVTWDSTNLRLSINRDNTASKTYDYGVANANKNVLFTLSAIEISSWESDDDLEIYVNGVKVVDNTVDGTKQYSFSVILDANGQVTIAIKPNTNDNAEDVQIDNISVNISSVYLGYTTGDFLLRKQLYAKGNMKTIGNTVLVAPNGSDNNDYCATYTNGAFIIDATERNSAYYLCGYSVDGTQTNATTSELKMSSSSSKVLWAGLYWQALISNGSFNPSMSIGLRREEDSGSSYVSFQPDELHYQNDSFETGYTSYSAFKDVTSTFLSNDWQEGNYTVSNVLVHEGKAGGLGSYGAWSLVVIYEDLSAAVKEKFRSFSVFDGWKQVTSGTDAIIPVSGFYTPDRALISSQAKVSVFTAEGDKNILGDKFETTNYNTTLPVVLPSGSGNTFQSLVTGGGERTPNAINNQGIDIQTFDIGDLLTNKQTDMSFTLSSTGDVYWPSMVAFSTELIAPNLCYDYSFRQDGAYLKTDNNGTQPPLITGYISNSLIDTSIYIRNNEADILAQGMSFSSDVNDSMFQYVPGSAASSNVNGSSLITRADTVGTCGYTDSATSPVACTNGSDIRIGLGRNAAGYSQNSAGTLGDKEFVYAKFTMNPIGVAGLADVNQSLGFKLSYYIIPKTGAAAIPYTYELGEDIGMCPPTSGYEPAWGTFNTVETGATTVGGIPVNNIRTKVSREPFRIDVAGYGKNAVTQKYDVKPTTDIATTLLVEAIDSGAYHDANATCANPASAISPAVFVPYTYSTAVGDTTVSLPLQNVAFHNFAVKNGAFRIWYFDDSNGTLIQNWTASTSDATRLTLTGISGLYKSGTHTVCTSECSASTSVSCFNCIKANYAKPLCSRDNFSVRPESYDIRLYDVNQTLAQNDAIKDNTKVSVSEQYDYPPVYATPSGRMPLAAGYAYRYDLNATGHDTDLSRVPGYTRNFNNSDPEYIATMKMDWDTAAKTGCNDISDKTINFYVASGQLSNLEHQVDQAGEYRFNILDTSWTEVDWKPSLTGHHTITNGFELISGDATDCALGNTYTVPSASGKIGCYISSDHNNTVTSQYYKDPLAQFKPAKFDLTGVAYGLGMNSALIATGGTGFVYDSNLSIPGDMPMAVSSSGSIKALGYNNTVLSNFVAQCYASDINISVSHDANASYSFVGRIDNNTTYNATTSPMQTISQTSFAKANNGATSPTIRLNVDRDVKVPQLPLTVHYNDENVSCANTVDCNVSAMSLSVPNTATGSKAMNFDVTHVYGRVIPNNVRIMGLIAFETIARYEVYMTPTLVLTPLVADPFDATWYVNTLHTEAQYGDATVGYVNPVAGSSLPLGTSTYSAGVETYRFNPYTIRQGYKGHINTEGWLWYGTNALSYIDPDAGHLNCLTHPCFDITFGRLIGNTGSAKTESETHKSNKKTSTGTGWSTTSEYAPSIQ